MKIDTSIPPVSQRSIVPELKDDHCSSSVATLEKPQEIVVDSSETGVLARRWSGAVFGSTFLTIFLAEFGDKTQLSTLLMSAQSQSPEVVFLGSAAALVTTSLLGVLLGCWLATRLSPRTVEVAAAASMLLISAKLLWEVVQF